ncbi:MAG: ABC transporter ATP-binding protein [Chloroflexota bacterium]|nr:MAG: ABC transporter ATP-binding protein [Chloroflexota bacterium]
MRGVTASAAATVREALLEIVDLEVHYDTVRGISRAVDGVSLTVNRGEILGIAGESGCGKSTLAAALLRLVRPPGYVGGGKIHFHIRGQEPVELLSADEATLRRVRWRHLSYVPQGSMNSLNPVMRVENQFTDTMRTHSNLDRSEIKARVADILRQVGLGPHVARMYPHELSGGMKQRVVIALAIALEPELVIADEPTTALDVSVQRMIIQTLADLRDRMGMTLIIVTHDMAVHAELADRVAVMYAGDIVEVGDVRQIFQQPRHPYTQALIHSIPQVGGVRARLAGIGGNAPTPLAWPPGCRFHPRCPYAMPICQVDTPERLPLNESTNGAHPNPLVACHLYAESQGHRLPASGQRDSGAASPAAAQPPISQQ